MLMFRDRLRSHAADRDLYARTKLDLAGRSGRMSRITPMLRPPSLTRSWGDLRADTEHRLLRYLLRKILMKDDDE